MTTPETIEHDKSSWGPGLWQNEPDRVDFEAHGLACMLIRNSMGNWCGYAAVERTHPLYEKHYNEVFGAIEVHGGLTYSDKCAGHICHVPAPSKPDDVWWFGFDCGHAFDYKPGLAAQLRAAGVKIGSGGRLPGEDYRDVAYARAETDKLAQQLAARA